MSKQASEFQEKSMAILYRGKEIFKPLNTGRIDERVSCVREFVANIFFYTKNGVTIMIDAGYNYSRLKEKMGWLDIDPADIHHILITHQDTDHVGAVETDSDGLFRSAALYIGEEENRYLTGEKRRRVIGGLYKLPMVKIENRKVLLKDGQVFTIGDIKIECFLVPGHTWGHMVYLIDDSYLFTGDTIWFGPDGGYSFINMLAEDNKLAVRSLAVLEEKLRERGLHPIIVTGHTGWTDDLDFAFAHKNKVCNAWRKQKPHDPAAPYDGYDESDDTDEKARNVKLEKVTCGRKESIHSMNRTILIYGAGVIGCELAHVLKRGGNDVTLLARGEWKNTLQKQDLMIHHYLQGITTTDKIRVIDQLKADDKYDVIFVVMQADQIFEVLPVVAANASRHVVMVGNNPWTEKTEQLISSASPTEKEVAFGFMGVGGRRENGQVISIHAGVHITVGGREKSLSSAFQSLLLDVFSKSGCKVSWENKMDAWLKCHMAEILPLGYVSYAVDCDLTNALAAQRKAMIDAAAEGFALLKALGYPIRPAGDEEFFTAGPKKAVWKAAMYAACKTPVGRLAVTDHCAHAVSEMTFLDSAWEELRRQKPDIPMPIWDSLRKNMPYPIEASKHSKTGINPIFRVKTDGFHGELFRPAQDMYPGKALICFSGSDGKFELSRMLAQVFQAHGLTALALAYVMEDGLPNQFYHVPIDTLESAAKYLHDTGYKKVGLWGISKGAELALTAGSLLPGLVNAVVAVAPMSIVCQGFSKEKGITVMPGSSWSFHGAEIPYNSFGIEKFPMGQVLRKSLKARELTMYDLYFPLVKNPDPAAIIRVENITGPILLLTSKMDTMWPSEPAAKQIMERLREQKFPYYHRHLSYSHGSHLFVPIEVRLAKCFVGDRGRYKEISREARMDSLEKTLEFVSQW